MSPTRRIDEGRHTVGIYPRDAATIVLLSIFAFLFRFPLLMRREIVEGDGVHYVSLARDILAGDWSGLSNPYWSNAWPALIAAVSRVSGLDVVESARIASLILGATLPALAYIVGRGLVGHGAAFWGGAFLAVNPWWIQFSTLAFSEPLFATAVLVLIGVFRALSRRMSRKWAVAAGVVAGVAALTRPEAQAVVAGCIVAMVFSAPDSGSRHAGLLSRIRVAGIVCVTAFAIISVRTAITYHYYDVIDFGLGTKASANLILGRAQTWEERERLFREVLPDGRNRLEAEARETSVLAFAIAHPLSLVRHLARNASLLAQAAWNVVPPVPILMGAATRNAAQRALDRVTAVAAFGVLMWGAVCLWRLARSETGARMLGSVAVLYLAGLLPLIVHERVLLALSPLLFLIAGLGFSELSWLFATRFRFLFLVVLALAGGALNTQAVLLDPDPPYSNDPVSRRDAAWFVRSRFGNARMLVGVPAIAYYAVPYEREMDAVDLPWLSAPELLDFARRERCSLLLVPEEHFLAIRHPAAQELLGRKKPPSGLTLVTTSGTAPHRVFVWSVDAPL